MTATAAMPTRRELLASHINTLDLVVEKVEEDAIASECTSRLNDLADSWLAYMRYMYDPKTVMFVTAQMYRMQLEEELIGIKN